MAGLDISEQVAVFFMEQHGLRCERFTSAEMREGKTPDFKVFKGSELVFYCEAKHIRHDDWLDKQLDAAQPPQIVGGLRPDPIFNRLTDRIHESVKQFNAVNPDRAYPNVLVLANSDRQCDVRDLHGVLTGNFYAEGGTLEPIYKQYSEGRIRGDKYFIDLYVWFDMWRGEPHKPTLLFTASQHYVAVCHLFGSDPTRHRRLTVR